MKEYLTEELLEKAMTKNDDRMFKILKWYIKSDLLDEFLKNPIYRAWLFSIKLRIILEHQKEKRKA